MRALNTARRPHLTPALADLQESALSEESFDVASSRECECSNGSAIDCDAGTCPTGVKRVYVRVRVNHDFETIVDYPGLSHIVDVSREVVVRAR